jgi:hypothetical protein
VPSARGDQNYIYDFKSQVCAIRRGRQVPSWKPIITSEDDTLGAGHAVVTTNEDI